MPQNRVDLVNIFQTVTQTLAQNQQALDQVDEYNHDHGANMVQTFQTITNSLQQKQGKSDSSALAYAAKKLAKNTTSGSGQLYAQGLTEAAAKFKGKQVDSKGALDLLQTLIGGGQTSQQTPQSAGGDILGALLGQMTGEAQSQPSGAAQPGGDMLTTLLGGLAGGTQTQQPQTAQPSGDMLSNLLGGLSGGQSSSSSSGGGLDLGDLVNAGMSYMQAKQQGGSTAQALIQAFMAASGMGNSPRRTQSTGLVVNSFLQALATSAKSR
ncbi:MAG: DAK2 domain-containing protein [Anaerolineales bacterium]|jgi:hypothetical protein